ncbi:MAG: IS1182 family transposase [Xanthomonadales bacterium]|jgi:transposase|nr:IS1182 family transposase [Xanthomonadales bacterium]
MSGFIQGEDRSQATLFPERLDDYVAEDSSVRVIDVFIDELDLSGMGFKTQPNETGRPAYHPTTMLKLFVYGYLNRVHSSRRLEREAQRNVELMWLTGRLAPDFKTIADFRKDNGVPIRLVCRQFVILCRNLNLFANAFVAIDGSKFKAVNNRDRNFTRAKMKRRIAEADATIEHYLQQLAEADRQEPDEDKTRSLEDKVASLKKEMARLKKVKARMLKAPGQQISLTDPDARSMKSRGAGVVGYNVQTAVDTKHHLIVAHEVTNQGSDRRQLANMAKQAKTTLAVDELTVFADRGYYRSEDLRDCEEANITTYLPKPKTSPNRAKGQFDRDAFHYIAQDDEYECPAGQRLVHHTTIQEGGKSVSRYWTYKCRMCNIKAQCTSGAYRKMTRWEHEEVLEKAQARLDRSPDAMRIRRATVEHPFGTLKAWMGSTHFLTRTLDRVSTEMSLHVLAYNMKRMMNIFGTKPLIEAIGA